MSARPALIAESKPTLLDYGVVEEGITRYSATSISRGRAFTIYIAREYFHLDYESVDRAIVDNGGDCGIDIIVIDDENLTIHLCNCKSVAKFDKSKRNFPGNEIDKIVCFLDDLLYHREELLTKIHPELSVHVRSIWEMLQQAAYKIEIHLFSNQLLLARHEHERFAASLARHDRVKLLEHGLYELAHGAVRAARPTFKKRIIPVSGSGYQVTENGHRGVQTRISLVDLISFLSDENNSTYFDERLLHHNVRFYLGRENPANRQIKATLLEGRLHDFWYLNNGLVIVCDQILGLENGHHPMVLMNPQIVNGGQTAKVIHDVSVETLSKIDTGSISVKIVETKDQAFINRIAIASNTQSRIFGRDLRAIDPYQQKLAIAVNASGYFYKSKRGEIASTDNKGVIDAHKAGQLLLAYAAGEPVRSKTNSNEIFDDLYHLAFDPNITTADLIIAAYEINDVVEKYRVEAVIKLKKLRPGNYEEPWIIEGHLHVIFVVGEMMRRSGYSLSDLEQAKKFVPHAVDTVSQLALAHPQTSGYRLFRSANSKAEIIRILDRQDVTPPAEGHQSEFKF